jgi:hypothetical protein
MKKKSGMRKKTGGTLLPLRFRRWTIRAAVPSRDIASHTIK